MEKLVSHADLALWWARMPQRLLRVRSNHWPAHRAPRHHIWASRDPATALSGCLSPTHFFLLLFSRPWDHMLRYFPGHHPVYEEWPDEANATCVAELSTRTWTPGHGGQPNPLAWQSQHEQVAPSMLEAPGEWDFSPLTLLSLLSKAGAGTAACGGHGSRTDTSFPSPKDQQSDHMLCIAALPEGGTFAGSS